MNPNIKAGHKRALASKFGWICWYCGLDLKFKERHLDHIIPKSRGGEDVLDNFALSCAFCNHAKHDNDLETFLAWLSFVSKGQSVSKVIPNGIHPLSSLWQDSN